LIFLGYLSEQQLLEVLRISKKIANSFQDFSLSFNKVVYAPPGKKLPRMIWVEIKKDKNLFSLVENLKKEIFQSKAFSYKAPEEKSYLPHLTLARFSSWKLRELFTEKLPEIEKNLPLSFKVDSIEIMESILKREGAEYKLIEKFKLGEKKLL
jgi:2'-5' RNA ligase